jgi:hypothetical protein
MPYPKQPGTGGGDADLSKAVLKTDNLATLTDKDAALTNIKATPQVSFDGVEGFASLRTRAPRYEGERVTLKYHTLKSGTYSKNLRGGGVFIARAGTRADDGGFTAKVTGQNWYWERDKQNIAELTADHFGAVGDGVTDDSTAIMNCYLFMNSAFAVGVTGDNSRRQGIVLNAGKYFIKPLDFSKLEGADAATTSGYKISAEFALRAAVPVHTGLHAAVTIISDKTDAPVFLVNHRRVTIHGINWDGQQTTAQDVYDSSSNPTGTNMLVGATMGVFNDTASNKQPFFKNVGNGGQYTTITCVNSKRSGGVVYDLLDTIDSTAYSIFGSSGAAPVIRIGWSGQALGNWNHGTAFKLEKANFQYFCAPALFMPRLTQGIWDDVWFEHSACPFDIREAQIEMRAVSVESSKYKPHAWRSRLIISQYSYPTGNDLDTITAPGDANWASYTTNPDGTSITPWQGDGELGYTRLDSAYSQFNNPVSVAWFSGSVHGANAGGSNNWIKIGRMKMVAPGTQMRFVIEATNGYNALKNTDATLASNNAPGRAEIVVQRVSSGFKATIEYSGQSAVLDNRLQSISTTDADLFIQFSGFVGGYSVHVYGSGNTRYETGTPDSFIKSGEVQTVVPTGTVIGETWWIGRSAGIGSNRGLLHIASPNVAYNTVYAQAPGGFVRANVNGSDLNLAWYGLIPVFTTQPTAQTVATGGTLTLTSAAPAGNSYQWYKDNVAISGATSSTYTKVNVTSADAGSYKVRITGAPAANFTDSNAVTVTVT